MLPVWGLPTSREEWGNLSFKEKQDVGKQMQRFTMTPTELRQQQAKDFENEIRRMKARNAPKAEIKAQSQLGKIQADINAGLVDPQQGAQQIANILDKSKGTPAVSKEERDRSLYIQLSTMREAGQELSTKQQKTLDILTREFGNKLPTTNEMLAEIVRKVQEGKPLTPQDKQAYQLMRDPFQLMLAQALGGPIATSPVGAPLPQQTPPAAQQPTPQPRQQGAANEITRQTRDGRIAVFDAQTKQFLRYQ